MKIKRKLRRKLLHLTQQMHRLWRKGACGSDMKMVALSRKYDGVMRPLNHSALAQMYQNTQADKR